MRAWHVGLLRDEYPLAKHGRVDGPGRTLSATRPASGKYRCCRIFPAVQSKWAPLSGHRAPNLDISLRYIEEKDVMNGVQIGRKKQVLGLDTPVSMLPVLISQLCQDPYPPARFPDSWSLLVWHLNL